MAYDKLTSFGSLGLGAVGDRVNLFGEGDQFGVRAFFDGAYKGAADVYFGFIVTYNPQTHSAMVHVHGYQDVWACTFADEMVTYAYGYSLSHPAREGDCVLLVPTVLNSQAGIIIGRVPYLWNFQTRGDLYNDPDQYHRQQFTQLDKITDDRRIGGFTLPFTDEANASTRIMTNFRPTDVYPGEFCHLNQHNCGIKGGMFSTTLLGGGAQLRMSALSNAARLSCESYMRYSLSSNLHEFHNSRYLSAERNAAMYQEERLGWRAPDGGDFASKVWDHDSKHPNGGENQTMRPRIKELSGYFGHLVSKFCLRPDPNDTDLRVQGKSKPKEEGVSRETIDPSGQYRLSAAGMIAIERTGRIPVPVRIAYPTDVGHEIPEAPETLKPFEHNQEDPCFRQLELFDRQAYDLKNQYARVDSLGNKKAPDYYVPQEEELGELEDMYDPTYFKNRTVELKKYDRRRAGVYIGEDGSVIVRDAWGSEIVMLAGNITLACAGNVMTLPGKTSLTIAGDDIVQKAQNSVDIHASLHDVRLSAMRNMEILGGCDDKKNPGGVIIESRGPGPSPWEGEEMGESASVSGITLKTNKQAVVVDGNWVNIRSKVDTRIISGDKKLDGNISISCNNLRAKGKYIYLADHEDAAVSLSRGSVHLLGENINLLAMKSITPIANGKYPVPIMWAPVKDYPAEWIPKFAEVTEDLEDEKKASLYFERKALDKMMFGFRTSEECGTESPWAIGAGGNFRMYEPAWAQVMRVYDTLKGIDAKKYEEKDEWGNGFPFPGKEAKASAEYAMLMGGKPRNLTKNGFNVSREDVEPKSETTVRPLNDNYLVRK